MDEPYRGLPPSSAGWSCSASTRSSASTRARASSSPRSSCAASPRGTSGARRPRGGRAGRAPPPATRSASTPRWSPPASWPSRTPCGLVAERAAAMADAGERSPGSMVAMLGGDDHAVRALADAPGPDDRQRQRARPAGAQRRDRRRRQAEELAREETGARARRLDVSAAFHSPLMEPAAERLADALAQVEIQPGAFPVYANGSAAPFKDVRARAQREPPARRALARDDAGAARGGHRALRRARPRRRAHRLGQANPGGGLMQAATVTDDEHAGAGRITRDGDATPARRRARAPAAAPPRPDRRAVRRRRRAARARDRQRLLGAAPRHRRRLDRAPHRHPRRAAGWTTDEPLAPLAAARLRRRAGRRRAHRRRGRPDHRHHDHPGQGHARPGPRGRAADRRPRRRRGRPQRRLRRLPVRLDQAAALVETGRARVVLVCGAEALSRLTDTEDRGTAVLFGDGAGAVVVAAGELDRGVSRFVLGCDPEQGDAALRRRDRPQAADAGPRGLPPRGRADGRGDARGAARRRPDR